MEGELEARDAAAFRLVLVILDGHVGVVVGIVVGVVGLRHGETCRD